MHMSVNKNYPNESCLEYNTSVTELITLCF